MFSVDTALTFFTLALLLGFTPGPDNLAVLMQSATQGRRSGLYMTLGLCAGLVLHTLAVALGLAAVFAASATAFSVLRAAGAAYLTYLAWCAFRAPAGPLTQVDNPPAPFLTMFSRGILMNLTNPKVVFFFLALLPQFVQAERGHVPLQLCGLGALFIAATLIAFGTITFFAAAFSRRLRQSTRAQQHLNWFAGAVFLALAVRLALTRR